MRKKIIGFLFLSAVSLQFLFAQEVLSNLNYNEELLHQNKWEQSVLRSAVPLPFVDDFSYSGPFPNPDLWMDNKVFVNNTYPVNAVSLGVATFEGLNQYGMPYDTAGTICSIGSSDTLTSMPVLLGSFSPSDSVYFSFFYQPQGEGDEPNSEAFNFANCSVASGDSLVLEFKDASGNWNHIWAHDGEPLQPFTQVLIPVISNSYFSDNFQFRFRNIATNIGNNDHWNLDYVKMNNNRAANDTIVTDVAVVKEPGSLLLNYQAMPWNQFFAYQSTELAPNQSVTVRNNFNVTKNTNYQYQVFEKITGTPIFNSGISSFNFNPLSASSIALPVTTVATDFTNDPVVIATKFFASASADNNLQNDTAEHDQYFRNYFAYDDGTAEKAYGVLGIGAKLAVEYHLNQPDTLRAVYIHFAHLNGDVDGKLFSLVVWSSLNPEVEIYRHDFIHPTYTDSINGFSFFRLDSAVVVSGTIYVGMQQTFADLLNIGFDMNDDAHTHLWYNAIVGDTFHMSTFPGAVMIRPVLGDSIPFGVGIEETVGRESQFNIYPNPVNSILNISDETGNDVMCRVTDCSERIILSEQGKMIDVHQLPAGIYFIHITDLQNGNSSIKKFIKVE